MPPGSLTFLHDWPDGGLNPAIGDVVIARTPEVVERAAGNGLETLVIDDLIDRSSLFEDSTAYRAWQVDWLDRLDRACGATGAATASAQLIVTPLDSVVVAARVIRAACLAFPAHELEYVGRGGANSGQLLDGHFQFWPTRGHRPLDAEVLPLVGAALGRRFRASYTAPPPDPSDEGAQPERFATLRWFRSLGVPRRAGPSALFLWRGGYGHRRYRDSKRLRPLGLRSGVGGTAVVRSSWIGISEVPPTAELSFESPSTGPDLAPFLEEFDEWTQLPGASSIVGTRLNAFIRGIVPAVGRGAHDLKIAIEASSVIEVVASNPSTTPDFAALLAAKELGIPRLLLQHGDHAFTYGFWLLTETQNFDELWVSDSSVVADLERCAQSFDTTVPNTVSSSPRVEDLRELAAKRSRPPVPLLAYVPTLFTGDSCVVGAGYFDAAWYHRWHVRLAEHLQTKSLKTIWKGFGGIADLERDPISETIGGDPKRQITFETGPLLDTYARATRVLLDFPSTPLYEAVHLGIPVFCLSFNRFGTVRPEAAEMFGRSLRCVDTEDEALAAIDEFLDTEPARWIVPSERILPYS